MKSKIILLAAAVCGCMCTSAIGQTAHTIYHDKATLTTAGKDPTSVEALAVKNAKTGFGEWIRHS